ncbi:MAG TPA: hypothetical protein VGG45_18390 [Terracidiphilus sp.]|jgi:hypothetical protein
MEIGPIPGIQAVPAVKAPQGDLRPPAIFDIDPTSRPGDDQAQRNGRKAAGVEEDAEDDLMLNGETDATERLQELAARQVDYFA